MTDINALTLAEVEALAVRLESAARTIRDAQSLLSGGGHSPVPETPSAPGAAAIRAMRPPGAPNPLLTAAENAERARLIKLNTMGPDDIDAMERA